MNKIDQLPMRLKKLRGEKKISQKTLADDLGVSQVAVAYWENGKRIPAWETLEKLATYFNVSPTYLLGWDNDFDLLNFGISLKEVRIKNRLSQKDFAERMNISEKEVRLIEAGQMIPEPFLIRKISLFFNLPIYSPFQAYEIIKLSYSVNSKTENNVKTDLSNFDKKYIISLIDQLNETGLARIKEHLEDLIKIPEYRIDSEPHEPTEEK